MIKNNNTQDEQELPRKPEGYVSISDFTRANNMSFNTVDLFIRKLSPEDKKEFGEVKVCRTYNGTETLVLSKDQVVT